MTDLQRAQTGAVCILTLNRPERRNALNVALRGELRAALAQAEADDAVRAIVICAAGGHFSAGGDLAAMEVPDIAAGRARMEDATSLVRQMVNGPKPLVAAVQGWCVGAGLSLALCCDSVIAGPDARFAATFAKVGLVADLGLAHTLPARIGQGRARQMLLGADVVAAPEALAMGLIDQVAADADAAALARAQHLAGLAPLSIGLMKAWLARDLDAALAWEREAQSMLYLSADHAEGKAAFLGKRPAIFRGK